MPAACVFWSQYVSVSEAGLAKEGGAGAPPDPAGAQERFRLTAVACQGPKFGTSNEPISYPLPVKTTKKASA